MNVYVLIKSMSAEMAKKPKAFQSDGTEVRLSSPLPPNGPWNGYSMI